MNRSTYTLQRACVRPALEGAWDEPAWSTVPVLTLDHWHARSSDHHPRVEAKVAYQDDGLFVFFRVQDRYVLSVNTAYQSAVCRDSCVEFFVEPQPGKGYFNFEVNCGGTLLLQHVEDPTRTPTGFRKHRPVAWEHGSQVRIHHSMPATVTPEIQSSVSWTIEYFVPFALFEAYLGAPLGPVAGQTWRANFYKCADGCSHPHWGSWAPVSGPLNFHVPACFAPIRFAE